MQRPSSRRQFLGRGLAAAAGGVLLAACGFGKDRRTGSDVSAAVTSLETRWPIKRVVFLMLENRSFNNLFATFPGAHGTTVGNDLGKELPLRRCPVWLPGDLAHDRPDALDCFNHGKVDNFRLGGRSPVNDYYAYSALHPSDVPNYWAWAKEYVLSDNFFSSVLGPSYPNHISFVAGSDLGVYDNPENTQPTQLHGRTAIVKAWGCDSAPGASVGIRAPDGSESETRPCFRDVTTVPDQLLAANLPWAYYAPTKEQVGYIWATLNSFPSIFETDAWGRHMRPVDMLVDDIKADRLPAVTWVVPRYQLSDHPPWSSTNAQNWSTEIVNAIMTSPMWKHTAIFLTWDEWGGFYDPVPPPQGIENGLGFRVPMIVISPYSQRGVIDSEVGEFASPLKFIQSNWGLDHHTERIRRTHDYSHVFDFGSAPRNPTPLDLMPTQGDPLVPPTKPDPSWPPQFQQIGDLGV